MSLSNSYQSLQYLSNKFASGLMLDTLHKMDYIPVKPTSIELQVEERCFFRCKHCDIWKIKKFADGLTFKEQKAAIKKIYQWLGKYHLVFSGGEPLMNPDFIPLLRYCSKMGIEVSTTSNGYMINEKIAKELVESGISYLTI